jgi:hypothetical protein
MSTGGEYLDHGLDVVNCAYIGVVASYAIGAGQTPTLVVAGLIPATSALTCWEQSITGVFRLGRLNQIESVIFLSSVLMADAVFGVAALTQLSLFGVSLQHAINVGVAASLVATVVPGFVLVHAKRESILPGLALLALHGAVWAAHATGAISSRAAYLALGTSAVAFGTRVLLSRLRQEKPGPVTAYVPAVAAAAVLVLSRAPHDAVVPPSACVELLAVAFVAGALRDALEIVRRVDAADRDRLRAVVEEAPGA